ncbi:MAG TPA: hypothetical protein VD735_05500 [Candidatus Saccharimonadales bacterium]|nr:hypothetical protein [Candidatus Saccharimonadales bacterium]
MRVPKVVIYPLIAIIVAVCGLVLFRAWFNSIQIKPATAAKICGAFSDQVKADITHNRDYTVQDSRRTCEPVEDEVGLQDYKLTVRFQVAVDDLDSETSATERMRTLARALPRRDYPVSITNMPYLPSPGALCVTASRYLDNDGKDVPQGPADRTYRYLTQADTDTTSCLVQ